MGYTHCWTPAQAFSPEQFRHLRSMVEQIISMASIAPWSIGIELDLNRGPDEIWFNGAPLAGELEDEVAHETFCLDQTDTTFQFCKTDKKPYDTVVVACLIAAEIAAQTSGFSMYIHSDGDPEDRRDGIALFESCFPGEIDGRDLRLENGTPIQTAQIIDLSLGYLVAQTVPTASLDVGGDRRRFPGSLDIYSVGALRVWWIHSESSDQTYYDPVLNLDQARSVLQTLSKFDSFLLGHHSSHGGVQKFIGQSGELDPDEPFDVQGWIDITDQIAPF